MKSLSFFKGLSWLILLNLLVKPVWIFFIDRQVQNIAGFDSYGKYFAILNLSFVLLAVADAGLSIMLNQRMAYHNQVNVAQFLRIKILLILLYTVACCFIAWLSHITSWQLLFYIILIQALTSLFVFLRSIITAHQYFTTDAWFSVIDKLLMILICGAMIYTTFFIRINLVIFLQVQTICTAVAVLLAAAFILKKQLVSGTGNETLSSILISVWPFAVCIFLMSVHYRLDGFLLERLHARGSAEAGIYAAAYRLLDAGNMVGYLAASFLIPFISRHQQDRNMVRDAVIHTRHGLIFFALGIVTFSIAFAPWIQQLLYHTSDQYISLVIALCVASLPGYYLVHVYGSVLTATARLMEFTRILLVTVIINVVLNLLLIPGEGALGCCIAAITSQYFCGIATCLVATRKTAIGFDGRSFLTYLLLTALLLLLFYSGRMVIHNVWIILAIAVIISLVLLVAQLGFFKKYFILLR